MPRFCFCKKVIYSKKVILSFQSICKLILPRKILPNKKSDETLILVNSTPPDLKEDIRKFKKLLVSLPSCLKTVKNYIPKKYFPR